VSFAQPPAGGRNASPLLVIALLFFCIGFASAYAVFSTMGLDFGRGGKQSEAPDTTVPPPPQASAPPVASAAAPTTAEVPEPPEPPASPADVAGLWPARHLIVGIAGTQLDDATRALLAEYKPGGVLLRPENLVDAPQTEALTRDIRAAVGLGEGPAALPVILVAQEGGEINPLKITEAPAAAALGAENNPEHVREIAHGYAQAARARGISAILAPVLDVYLGDQSEAWLAQRAFGSEPDRIVALAASFAEGLREGGVIAIAKHYPGLGAARYSPARVYEIPAQNTEELALHLLPFVMLLDRHLLPGILAGMPAVPNLDKAAPTRPAALSPLMIGRVLREQRKYGGVVVCDDISVHAATSTRPPHEVVREALQAGCDAIIISQADPDTLRRTCEYLVEQVNSGAIAKARITEARERLDGWTRVLAEWKPAAEAPPAPAPAEAAAPAGEQQPLPPPTIADLPAGAMSIQHVLQQGETLQQVAEKYGIALEDLLDWNGLDHAENIKPGTALAVVITAEPKEAASPPPTDNDTYTVQPGDGLRRIAERYNTTEAELVKINGLESANLIRVGQKLKVPKK
jgi:beta-N-acetylhexosaminidase